MHRLLGILTCFTLTVSIAYAIPARPLYVPDDPPKAPAVRVAPINIAGTAWLGKYSAAATQRLFVFEADGTVSYRSPAGKTTPIKNRGNWRVEGNTLIFDHFITKGNTLMEFRGVIQDPNTIVGESWNKAGVKTPQTMQRTTVDVIGVNPKIKIK